MFTTQRQSVIDAHMFEKHAFHASTSLWSMNFDSRNLQDIVNKMHIFLCWLNSRVKLHGPALRSP
jgi:hypothetical protein